MTKTTRRANRKAAIFSATLLGTLLILAASFSGQTLQQRDAQPATAGVQMLAMPARATLIDSSGDLASSDIHGLD